MIATRFVRAALVLLLACAVLVPATPVVAKGKPQRIEAYRPRAVDGAGIRVGRPKSRTAVVAELALFEPVLSGPGIEFAPLAVGQSRIESFVITNASDDEIVLTDGWIDGADATEFHFEDVGTGNLLPRETTRAWVTFSPDAVGTRSARLVIRHRLEDGPRWDVADTDFPLSGRGSEAPRSIKASPVPIDFGEVILNEYGSATVAIRNEGPTAIRILDVFADYDSSNLSFFIPGGETCDTATLAPGGSCTLSLLGRVQSRPGSHRGYFVIETDGLYPYTRVAFRITGEYGPDTKPPTMTYLGGPVPVGAYRDRSRVRVEVPFAGADDQDVAGYQVQWRKGTSGSWTWALRQEPPFTRPFEPITKVRITVPAGQVSFRVRSVDRAGHVSGWMTMTRTLSYRDITMASAITRTRWKSVKASSAIAGTLLVASGNGQSRGSMTFTGTHAALVARLAPNGGSVIVQWSVDDSMNLPTKASTRRDLKVLGVVGHPDLDAKRYTVEFSSSQTVYLDAWIIVR